MFASRKRILSTAVVASLALPAIPALAELEEVIVTARKREESILKVPIAATAFNGEELEQFKSDDLYTLTERVPGFVMGTQVASIGPTPSLRGIGTGTLNPTIDQSVSLNIDGMGFSQALAFSSGMFDMGQMEVLRGPQSLFYGKNSTAGVISITTRDPGEEFEASLGTSYEFEGEEAVGEFVISGPLSETLGARLAVKYSDLDGYFSNDAVGDGITGLKPVSAVPNREETILRGTLLWEPSDQFTAKLKVNHMKMDQEGSGGSGEIASCPNGNVTPDLAAVASYLAFYYGTTAPQFLSNSDNCKLDGHLNVVDMNPNSPLYTGIRNNGRPFSYLEQDFGSLQLNFELSPEWSLASVTGYQDTSHEVMINGGQSGFAGPLIVADTNFDRTDFTQELRLNSDLDGALNYMFGAYYQDGEMANQTGLFFLGPRDTADLEIKIETVSVFGQLLYQITPELELAAGARWTNEDREFNPTWLEDRGAPTPSVVPGQRFDPALYGNRDSLTASEVSPEISLTYTPSDNLTYFVSYREAFKSGSWDTVSNPTSDVSFGDENVTGFEGGIKTRLLDNTLAVNVSAYDYKYEDLQVGANQSTATGFTIVTQNAASAEVYGLDLDFTYQLSESLQVFGVANWNQAEYDKYEGAKCWGGQTAAQGCNQNLSAATGLYNGQDLSGGDLLRAPEFQASFGFTYEQPIASDSMVMSIGSSTQYSDKYANNTLLRDDFYQESFYKTSLTLGLRDANDAWQVSLVGKNLNDEITAGNCTNFNGLAGNVPGTSITGSPTGAQGIAGIDELTCIAERGREIWLSVKILPALLFK